MGCDAGAAHVSTSSVNTMSSLSPWIIKALSRVRIAGAWSLATEGAIKIRNSGANSVAAKICTAPPNENPAKSSGRSAK